MKQNKIYSSAISALIFIALLISSVQSMASQKIRIDQPFITHFKVGSIEKAAFDFALVARTQNVNVLSYFYSKTALERELIKVNYGKNKWFLAADYSRHFAIELEPQVDKDTYIVIIEYYFSKKFPKFQTLLKMKKIVGSWKIV